MTGYDPIAPFYDKVHGSRKQTITYIKQLLKAYHPKAKTLLSLACGTGEVCRAFKRRYKITGLDISKQMLEVAQKKLPKVKFYHQNMVDLNLDEKFDVVLCLFASINHVLEFNDWESFFGRVKAHLNPGGIFIFDMMSELCLYNMVLNSPILTRTGKMVTVGDIEMFGEEGEGTIWRVKGFNVTRNEQTELFSSSVRQTSFDYERIYQALSQHFDEVLVEDPEQGEVTERSELLYFVCR